MPLVDKTFSQIITFTRASTGTFFDATGTLQSAAIDAPRLDFNPSTLAAQGLLIEEQRTNGIPNNTMQGAVPGVPGTPPTGWFTSTAAGITRELIGTGTENGVTYIDYRFSGTATGSSDTQLVAGSLNPAASGQSWTVSNYAKIVAGTLTNVTVTQLIVEYDAAGLFLVASTQNITPTTAALSTQRFALTRAFNNASTANAGFVIRLTSAGAIDITLRIGLPQLEQGAFATSVIPTTTIALTRSADMASVNTLSPWFNATEGTIYVDFAGRQAGTQPYLMMLSNTGETDRIYQRYVGSQYQTIARVAGVDVASVYNSSEGSAVNAKIASAYNSSQLATSTNGQAVTGLAVASLSSVPSGLNKLWLGSFTGTSAFANGYLRRITYYPRRLSNAELQAITA